MKKLFTILLILIGFNSFSQDLVTTVKTNTGQVYIGKLLETRTNSVLLKTVDASFNTVITEIKFSDISDMQSNIKKSDNLFDKPISNEIVSTNYVKPKDKFTVFNILVLHNKGFGEIGNTDIKNEYYSTQIHAEAIHKIHQNVWMSGGIGFEFFKDTECANFSLGPIINMTNDDTKVRPFLALKGGVSVFENQSTPYFNPSFGIMSKNLWGGIGIKYTEYETVVVKYNKYYYPTVTQDRLTYLFYNFSLGYIF